MDFYFVVKSEEDAKKLGGLVFFSNPENENDPMTISGDKLSGWYSATNGGYDYDSCNWDAESACYQIKESVGVNARVMFASEEDEGTGCCTYVWSDFGETETHSEYAESGPRIGEIDDEEWIAEVKRLVEEY